jgi:hypothetical protein
MSFILVMAKRICYSTDIIGEIKMILMLSLIMAFQLNAENLSTRAFYSNFLYSEKAPSSSHISFEGFIENTSQHMAGKKAKKVTVANETPSYSAKDIEYMLGAIHNIMLDTFYSCAATAPRANTFNEAVNGKYTPDSQHYASLIHSALSLKGIKTDFFKTPTHYGIHYEDDKTGKEMYWCIITPLAMRGPAKNKKQYAAIFNKYKNPEINGRHNITESEIELISPDEFAQMNMMSKRISF